MGTPFHQLLRECLAAKSLSQKDFARHVGRSYSFVNKVACGHRAPSDDYERWADALDLHGTEREAFLDAAALATCPPRIQDLVRRLLVSVS